MVKAICKELEIRNSYLGGDKIETIYFGGGTPSLLNEDDLRAIMKAVDSNFKVNNLAEVTLEANPEDIHEDLLKLYHDLGINRLSLGIQSFNDQYLKYLNRNHGASVAIEAIEKIQNSEIQNFSIDLIFGIKPNDMDIWKNDLKQGIALSPPHISVYNLTIEEKTVFGNWAKKGRLKVVEDDQSADQYKVAHELLQENGYVHYEISNYGQAGYLSQHNTSYWKNSKYLGVGPGAHSYDIESRQYNVSNNSLYLKGVDKDNVPFKKENLSLEDKVNERILTGLRTMWGCDVGDINKQYDFDLFHEKNQEITSYQNAGLMITVDQTIKLTLEGQLLADLISQELMI